MKGIIFIAHGSKKETSNNEFLKLIEIVSKEDKTYDLKKAAFLELAEPSIPASVEEFIQKGVKEIYLYPFFLNSGKHVLIDLPNFVKEFQEKYSEVKFIMLQHFGKSEKIKDIILNDINK